MFSARIYRPAAVLVTAGVFLLGAGQAAGATTTDLATGQGEVNSAEYQLDLALSKAVTEENIGTLLDSAHAAGDTESVRLLTDARSALEKAQSEKVALASVSASDVDIIAIVKRIAKLAQPIVVAALRVGGDGAATILESIAKLVTSIPGVGIGGPITDVVLRSIATGLRVGGAVLAEIIEGIRIEGTSRAEAQTLLTQHLRTDAGLPQASADTWGAVLAQVATA
ncbi:hypothetical protein [Amycolatopsis cihanbeyliensis]|uniref:DUF5667 domain-containing protein n=1 Tax=Amycolatopsis cihanbeyliensis TaxID=1128664 RepID=A0A542CTN9_AMYCI|nr:hypothetical protein [Amycolatopsis cihanbeyliensis]TQI94188.1 hypothetical protein FB471_6346 [Amycolatopsis cihanbeyliensis]